MFIARVSKTNDIYLNGGTRDGIYLEQTELAIILLNSILEYVNEPLIYKKDDEWYWKDGEIFKKGWNRV